MSRSDRLLVASGVIALAFAAAAGWILLAPSGTVGIASDETDGDLLLASPLVAPSPAASQPVSIIVDVAGAVAAPGIQQLPAGARVADAIAAAGGYAADVDLDATAAAINLAQPLVDGQQVIVPRAGSQAAVAAAPANPGAPATGGLVDLNTATPEELEALPGIGAVTVQKIVAARQEQPFASLEDAVTRGVIHRGQLEDIQGLATAG